MLAYSGHTITLYGGMFYVSLKVSLSSLITRNAAFTVPPKGAIAITFGRTLDEPGGGLVRNRLVSAVAVRRWKHAPSATNSGSGDLCHVFGKQCDPEQSVGPFR